MVQKKIIFLWGPSAFYKFSKPIFSSHINPENVYGLILGDAFALGFPILEMFMKISFNCLDLSGLRLHWLTREEFNTITLSSSFPAVRVSKLWGKALDFQAFLSLRFIQDYFLSFSIFKIIFKGKETERTWRGSGGSGVGKLTSRLSEWDSWDILFE